MKNFRRGLLVATAAVTAGAVVSWASLANTSSRVEGAYAPVEDYLHSLQLVSLDELPAAGTFWSLAKDEPPLPFFRYANLDVDVPVPVYLLGRDGNWCSFLVDDRAIAEFEVLLETAERAVGLAEPLESGPPEPGEYEQRNAGDGPAEPLSSYITNCLWNEILHPGTNAFNSDSNATTVVLHETIPDIEYELLSKQTLTDTVWTVEQSVLGAPDTNLTPVVVPIANRTNTLFFWARSWIDSTGNGLPD